MNRRETLKRLMIASGGLIALPSWAKEWKAGDLVLVNSSFSIAAIDTLASVADTIIPAGNSLGASSVGVDKFLVKLIDECYDPDAKEKIKVQLAALEKSAMSLHSKAFMECDQKQREELLLKLAASEIKEEKEFFTLIKSETIRGFSTSREVMMNYLNYKPVPGHYYGCVDVKA